jgi:hypothetical protein
MKAKIWVLCTVLTDENAPAMPAVFADEAEARAAYDNALRAEWDTYAKGSLYFHGNGSTRGSSGFPSYARTILVDGSEKNRAHNVFGPHSGL